jgi:2-oxo-4-hydroxy-4-carboxy-5-ureidoimidazoline decarboxylase
MSALDEANAWPRDVAVDAFLSCCDVPRWAQHLADARPFPNPAAAVETAVREAEFSPGELERALRAHPRIGHRASGDSREAAWSRQEQRAATTTDADRQDELRAANRAYEQRFGHVFLIYANGRTAEEILAALKSRLANDPATERGITAQELRSIIALRVGRLVGIDNLQRTEAT